MLNTIGLRRVAKKREKAGSSISSYDWGNIFFQFYSFERKGIFGILIFTIPGRFQIDYQMR